VARPTTVSDDLGDHAGGALPLVVATETAWVGSFTLMDHDGASVVGEPQGDRPADAPAPTGAGDDRDAIAVVTGPTVNLSNVSVAPSHGSW
jgi:hypothetical protein